MDKRIGKNCLILTIISVINLLLLGTTTTPVEAGMDEIDWSRVNIPRGGEAGNWVLAGGSDVNHLTMANDGTLYAYANPSATSYTLFKSTDSGYSWGHIGNVRDTIVDIAVTPGDAAIIYYATMTSVYKSIDAGKSFVQLPPNAGGAGTDNITISCIDVICLDGNNILAAGTRDNDNFQFGGVYTLDESKLLPDWVDTNLGNYNTVSLAFSPNFAADWQIVAVVTNEQDTIITTRIGSGGWNQVVSDATIDGISARAAAIAFPDDYIATFGNYILFVAIDTGSGHGDVYKVYQDQAPNPSIATDLDIGVAYNLTNVDVSALVISGNTSNVNLFAGTAGNSQVYYSRDNGLNWKRSKKAPTGQSGTELVISHDFKNNGPIFSATSGTESAFSISRDGGTTWNQIGLIDTEISNNGIIDLAISPTYNQDKTLFMITFDSTHTEHSLWRRGSVWVNWERIFSGRLDNVDNLSLVELSPEYGNANSVVLVVGTTNENPVIWTSADNGQYFFCRGTPFPIDILSVVNDNNLFIGSYNGTSGLVYCTSNGGLSYSTGAAVGNQPLNSIILSPHYQQDKTLLIGNTNGWVYYSCDNGTSFKSLPLDATSPPLSGSITVAFDSEFNTNNTVYAASNSVDKGIYRFVIGESTEWERLNTTLPVGGTLDKIVISSEGVLYSTNSQPVDTAANKGGFERSLNPTYPSGPTFKTIVRGLDDGVNLRGLWVHGIQLWSFDTQNTRLLTFIDYLARPVSLVRPIYKASATGTENVFLEWELLKGATEYIWQIDYDTDFSTVPTGFEGNTKTSTARLPELDVNTVYYWRVRATKPLQSKWSDEWSFRTGLGSSVIVPELLSPKAGVVGVSSRPLFQWSTIAGANSYEIVVSTDYTFGNPAILKIGEYSLPSTAWESTTNLDYNTTYYWKVRASGPDTHSVWSAVGAFTTELDPSQVAQVPEMVTPTQEPPPLLPEPPVSSPTIPSSSQSAIPVPVQQVLPDWALYLVGALIFVIVLLLIILLTLVGTIRRT